MAGNARPKVEVSDVKMENLNSHIEGGSPVNNSC